MTRGELLYCSPECPTSRRIFAAVNYFTIQIIGVGLGGYILLDCIFNFHVGYSKDTFAFSLFLLFIGFGAASGIPETWMYLHFRIYSNGTTAGIRHWLPWSKCNTLERRFGPKSKRFLRWDQMICFERALYKRDKYCLTLHLKMKNRFGARILPESYQYLTEDGREAILTLVDALNEHGIGEIQVICPNCGKKPYVELEYCPYCGTRRYGGEENEYYNIPTCPTCAQSTTYVPEYDRWYCHKCDEYAPEEG